MYFLDTNTCIYFLNGKYESVKEKLLSTASGEIKIPAIVKAELLYGANKSQSKSSTLKKLNTFLDAFEIIPFTDEMSFSYADIRASLEKKETLIGPNDLFIASTVLQLNGTLVTNNVDEFKRVPKLKIENWVK